MNNILIIFYFIIALGIFLAPVIAQYFTSIKINKQNIFSIYGIYLAKYLLIQMIFAVLNNNYYKKEYNDINKLYETKKDKKYNIMCVGYKEDPILFENCLISIKKIETTSPNLNRIYIIIDSLEDEYMEKIFKKVFEQGIIVRFEKLHDIDEMKSILFEINENRIICISQQHKHKRSVLYTGFKLTELENKINNDMIVGVMCTDSDTDIDMIAPEVMFDTIYKDNTCGAITGELRILKNIKNKTFFTLMSSIRYWYAFNIERAYYSYKGSVLCVSGPLGMYNTKCIEFILDDWYNQKYLGKECTYGDDRHLTNKILGLGKKIYYNPVAKAFTETPGTMIRLFKQQTRWNRSANREILWNIMYLKHVHLTILIDLIYIFLYPFIIIGYLLFILFKGTLYQYAVYISILFVVGIIKGLYGILLNNEDKSIIFFTSYSFIYYTIIIPSRLFAFITPTIIEWGTTQRNEIDLNINLDYIPLILWNFLLITGKCIFLYNNRFELVKLSFNTLFYIVTNLLYILHLFITKVYQSTKIENKKFK